MFELLPNSEMTRPGMGRKRDYNPIHWSKFFTESENVITNENGDLFHIYRRGSSGPLLVLVSKFK